MADETPNSEEEIEPTAADEGVADAASTEEAPEEPTAPAPAAEPVVPQTPKERKVARRAARGTRRPASQEERDAARKAKAVARSRRRKQEREKATAAGKGSGTGTPPREHGEGAPKERVGIVTSDKADKTISVRVDNARRHRRYEKIVRNSVKFHAHDESNDANTGDRVRIVESRPLSASKRWKLVEVLERAK